jgi:hypothetical protein
MLFIPISIAVLQGHAQEGAGSAVIHTIRRNYKKPGEYEIASLWYTGEVI